MNSWEMMLGANPPAPKGRVVKKLTDDEEGEKIFYGPGNVAEQSRLYRERKKKMATVNHRTNAFTVDKNVPIPEKTHVYLYPWNLMEVGDSFLVPCEKQKQRTVRRQVHDAAGKWRVADSSREDIQFVTHYVDDEKGVRVWRTQ